MYKKNSKMYHFSDLLLHPLAAIEYWKLSRADYSYKSHEKVVFVLGAPRSGTTIVYKTIKDNFIINGFNFETEIFSKKRLSNYQRFKEYISEAKFNSILSNASSRAEFFIELHKDFFQSSPFIEKTPQHVFYLDLLSNCFPNALFVNIIRDPRDAFLSGFENGNIPQANKSSNYFNYWKKCINAAKDYQIKNPDRVCNIFYEQFVNDHQNFLEKIEAFTKIPRNHDGAREQQVDPRGNLKKFEKLNKGIDNSSVFRWKKSELKDELVENSKMILKELESFNYEC